MRCNNCGHEYNNANSCPYCGAKNETVRIMSREEANSYDGLTLDAGTNEQTQSSQDSNSNGVNFKVYTLSSMSWLQKLMFGLFLVILGLVAAFALLPLMVVVAIAAIFFCFFRRESLAALWAKAKSIYYLLRQFKR